MHVSYNKLWKLLIDKKMMKVELRTKAQISTATLATIGKDQNVSMNVLKKICTVLDCNIGDIVEFLPDTDNETNTIISK